MVKKLFAVASVTALTGLVSTATVAGCSSDPEVRDTPSDGGQDATPDGNPPPVPPVDSGPEPPGTCMVSDPIDATKGPYKSPRIKEGACDTGAVKLIEDLVASNKDATLDELKVALADYSTECAACVFAEEGDTWAPVVESGGKIVLLNSGGCIEIVSGKADCGRTSQQWINCIDVACSECPAEEKEECDRDAQQVGGPCREARAAVAAACGSNNIEGYLDTCFNDGEITILGAVRTQCIGTGVKDAGGD
jgi:hypothetical protein